MRNLVSLGIALLILVPVGTLAEEGAIKGDAEAAKHGDEAAQITAIEEENLPDFIFRQFDLPVLSHYSYLIGSRGEAIVVDPARDVDVYLKAAKDLQLKIVGVYLTHSHADFVAGHMEVAKATGAPVYINGKSEAGYKHKRVDDFTEINFGNVRSVVRLTPGHTPDGTCLFVHHPADAKVPKLCLTGDTLFIGSVGRPDLMGGTWSAAQLAEMIYDTWNNILAKVPNETKIYPAHGAGSLCGANLSDANVSTFGEQKQTNPYTKHKDKHTFIMAVLEGLPKAPQYFAENAAMNKEGPALVDWDRKMPNMLSPPDVLAQMKEGAWVIDVREAAGFAKAHVADALNIPIRGRFETWTGIMVPWGTPFVLVGSDKEVAEAAFRLHRIGYDHPAGYLAGGVEAWAKADLPTRNLKLVEPAELKEQMGAATAPLIVDVRLPKEWMGLRISETILNMPINELAQHSSQLDPDMPVMTVCNSAYRSSMGASVLLKQGFKNVLNLKGGGKAWIEAGFPTFSAEPGKQAAAPQVFLDLPERMSPTDLAQRMTDLPGSVEVVDIRPEWQYEEYHIPSSALSSPADVLSNPSYLVGKVPLVIVCRDGSISAAVGGTIAPKTERSIRYVSGGVTAYWAEVMKPAGVITEKMVKPPASPAAPAPKATPAPSTPERKRPSAGC